MSSKKILLFVETVKRHRRIGKGLFFRSSLKNGSTFLSPPAEFSSRFLFLKFQLKNSEWGGKVLESGVSQREVKQPFSPCPSSAYAEDHGLCPWMNA
jgi:hypothetical protein